MDKFIHFLDCSALDRSGHHRSGRTGNGASLSTDLDVLYLAVTYLYVYDYLVATEWIVSFLRVGGRDWQLPLIARILVVVEDYLAVEVFKSVQLCSIPNSLKRELGKKRLGLRKRLNKGIHVLGVVVKIERCACGCPNA